MKFIKKKDSPEGLKELTPKAKRKHSQAPKGTAEKEKGTTEPDTGPNQRGRKEAGPWT
jgi:hypothetical protein